MSTGALVNDSAAPRLRRTLTLWNLIIIGMVIVQDPDLLLIDEPVAGMTDEESVKTGELLVSIAVSGIVMASIVSAIYVGIRTTTGAQRGLDQSNRTKAKPRRGVLDLMQHTSVLCRIRHYAAASDFANEPIGPHRCARRPFVR